MKIKIEREKHRRKKGIQWERRTNLRIK